MGENVNALIKKLQEGQELVVAGNIDDLEKKLLDFPQVSCPVIHRFFPGIYIREVTLPPGITAIGHRQKLPHLNVFLKGRVIMQNADGSFNELVAPMVFMGNPGRKVGYVVEEVVWQNIYPTTETNVETLEETYLDKSQPSLDKTSLIFTDNQKLRGADRDDYLEVLKETGFTHSQALAESENGEDQCPMPHGYDRAIMSKSPIEGVGYFATYPIKAGEIIAPARINGKRTPAGRYVNHAKTPNAHMVRNDVGNIDLIALSDIEGCVGGNLGDEITVDYRQSLAVSGRIIRGELCQV